MTTASAPAGWYADPLGRHEHRYWSGTAWTDAVADRGVAGTDPLSSPTETTVDTTADTAVDDLVATALSELESAVSLGADGSCIVAGGEASVAMAGAEHLRQAVERRPGDPMLHHAWASALATAAQWQRARTCMEALHATHPDFPLARFALEGWERWTPTFMLPPWTRGTTDPHPRLRAFVKGRVLVATRDGITPRAALFVRDVNAELDAATLRAARVDLATVVSEIATAPQLVVLYVRLWDDPTNPYVMEIPAAPFTPRGEGSRTAYELLCTQDDLDLVVLDPGDRVLCNRRMTLPAPMRRAHAGLLDRLLADPGHEIAPEAALEAVQRHSGAYPMESVPFATADDAG